MVIKMLKTNEKPFTMKKVVLHLITLLVMLRMAILLLHNKKKMITVSY